VGGATIQSDHAVTVREFKNLFMFRQGAALSAALRSEYQITAVEIVAYFTRLPWIAQEQLLCDCAHLLCNPAQSGPSCQNLPIAVFDQIGRHAGYIILADSMLWNYDDPAVCCVLTTNQESCWGCASRDENQ